MSFPEALAEHVGVVDEENKQWYLFAGGGSVSVDVWEQWVKPDDSIIVITADVGEEEFPVLGFNASSHPGMVVYVKNLGMQGVDRIGSTYNLQLAVDSDRRVKEVFANSWYYYRTERFAQSVLRLVPEDYRVSQVQMGCLNTRSLVKYPWGPWVKVVGSNKISYFLPTVSEEDLKKYDVIEPWEGSVGINYRATKTLSDFPEELVLES